MHIGTYTLFNLNFDVVTHMALSLEKHRQQGRWPDTDLVGNRRMLKLETLVTDLVNADNMVLLADQVLRL